MKVDTFLQTGTDTDRWSESRRKKVVDCQKHRHEGVKISRTLVEKGKISKYYFEDPYTVTQQITVTAKKSARADFQLALRSSP